jgi:vacuolar-type H+-ATPase subunit F/Vma7
MTAGAQTGEDPVERSERVGCVVVIGSQPQVVGFALAGARVRVAEDPDQVRSAWQTVGDDVAVVLLTDSAAASLADERLQRHSTLSVVMAPVNERSERTSVTERGRPNERSEARP